LAAGPNRWCRARHRPGSNGPAVWLCRGIFRGKGERHRRAWELMRLLDREARACARRAKTQRAAVAAGASDPTWRWRAPVDRARPGPGLTRSAGNCRSGGCRRLAAGEALMRQNKIPAEMAFQHQRLEILVCRGNKADIKGHGSGATERYDLSVFQHPEHLGLTVEAHLTDLVEKIWCRRWRGEVCRRQRRECQ